VGSGVIDADLPVFHNSSSFIFFAARFSALGNLMVSSLDDIDAVDGLLEAGPSLDASRRALVSIGFEV
jgi:hypothetical protein